MKRYAHCSEYKRKGKESRKGYKFYPGCFIQPLDPPHASALTTGLSGTTHLEQLFRADGEVIGSAAAAQNVSRRSRVVNAFFQQGLGDMHGNHFAQHQPGRPLVTIDALELPDLLSATYKRKIGDATVGDRG